MTSISQSLGQQMGEVLKDVIKETVDAKDFVGEPTVYDPTNPVKPSPEAYSVIWGHKQAIWVAPMLTFFRRYPNAHGFPLMSHRIIALSLDFHDSNVTQNYKEVVDQVHDYCLGVNLANKSYTWAQLPYSMQDRLLKSSLLPIEFLSMDWMENNADFHEFRLIMTDTVYKALVTE